MMTAPQIVNMMGPNGQIQQVQVMAAVPPTSQATHSSSFAAPTTSYAAPSSSLAIPSSNFMMQTNPVVSLSQASSTLTTQVLFQTSFNDNSSLLICRKYI